MTGTEKLSTALREAQRRYYAAQDDWRNARRIGDREGQASAESRQAQAAQDQRCIRRAMQLVEACAE